jgi:CBS-domain-containing membrane protein
MSTRCVSTIADQVLATEIMSRDVVTVRKEEPVGELVRKMLRVHIGSIPVVDERGHPRGIVTKTDLVELLTKPDQIATATAADVMMPLAIVLDDRATVAHCASMMALEDFHHVMVVSPSGALIGVVSSQDVVRWLVANDAVATAA